MMGISGREGGYTVYKKELWCVVSKEGDSKFWWILKRARKILMIILFSKYNEIISTF